PPPAPGGPPGEVRRLRPRDAPRPGHAAGLPPRHAGRRVSPRQRRLRLCHGLGPGREPGRPPPLRAARGRALHRSPRDELGRRLRALGSRVSAVRSRWAALPFVLAVLAPGAASAKPPDPDPWVGQDKALHVALSTMFAAEGYGISTVFTDRIAARVAFGAGLAITAGAAKELLDLAGLGHHSWKDFAWDVFG